MFMISCFNVDTKKMEHFNVPESVYVYVKQLENKIRYPALSKLTEVYSERFGCVADTACSAPDCKSGPLW